MQFTSGQLLRFMYNSIVKGEAPRVRSGRVEAVKVNKCGSTTVVLIDDEIGQYRSFDVNRMRDVVAC